ncbi:redoxin domain-containing protein [Pedobacter ginsengisoli]|nr:DUF6263 family protein [Pedobacter ginsengisoli]
MSRLLTLLFVFSFPYSALCQELNVPNGQQFAYTWHVVGKGGHKYDQLRTYIFRSLGRNDKGDNVFECQLVRAVEKDDPGASPDLDTDNPKATVFNNSGVLTPLALLQQPLTVTVSAKGKLLDIDGYDAVLSRVDRDWELQKGIRSQIESRKESLGYYIQDMFFQFPDQPIGSSGEWKDKRGVSYKMERLYGHPRGAVKVNKEVPEFNKASFSNESLLQISFVREGDVEEKGIYILDPKTGLVRDFSKNKSFEYSYSSVNDREVSELAIVMETNPKESNLDTAWLNMAIKTGLWSAAFGSGQDYNLEKMQRYFKTKDAQFEKTPLYQVNKLSLLQKLRKNPKAEALYSDLLMSIPNAYLSVPGLYHHLINKFHQLFEKDARLAYEVAGYFYQTKDFNSWLHETSAQNFLSSYSSNKESWDNGLEVVRLMHTDKNLAMRQTADPLFYWSQANKNPKDLNKLLSSANALSKMDNKTMQLGKGGRYGVLVYQLLVNEGKQAEANHLLDAILDKLHVVVVDTLYGGRKDDRSILAHAYQLKYLARKGSGDVNAIKYLSLAAQYSPTGPADKSRMSRYDKHFLKSKETYRQDFVEMLFSSGNEKQALKTFAAHISAEPESLEEMKSLYLRHFPQNDFKALMSDEVIVSWEKAPDFKLKDLNDNERTLKDYSGKWMVIDFWGTWCGPCVAELPEINTFNKELDEGKYPGATFLSIACKDYEQTVKAFLTKNNYEIPVLMSDNKIQFKYNIDGYPYKVMVSPTGRMITLERGKDWRKILKLFNRISGVW